MFNEQNDKKNYTLVDIEKYLQGKMSSIEMYELEKAALRDPFLADAIEGYSYSTSQKAHQHLQFIQQKLAVLSLNKANKPIVARFWFKAAASIVSFVCIYTICGLVFDQEKSLSKNTIIEQQVLPPKTAVNIEPMTKSYKNKVYHEPVKKENRNTPVIISEENNNRLKITNEGRDFFKDDKAKADGVPQTPVIIGLDKEVNKDQLSQIQVAQSKPKELEKSSTNDYRTENKKRDEFSHSKVQTNAIGPRANQTQQNTYGSIANQTEISKQQQEEKFPAEIVAKPNNEAYPEGGWQAFELYVHNSLKDETKDKDERLRMATTEKTTGTEVEFSIDEKGKPYNIRVIHSSGNTKHDNKIVSILQEGPKWIIQDQTKRTKATIKL